MPSLTSTRMVIFLPFLLVALFYFFFFFFQAEDGIRDHCVTGVQTCALPICDRRRSRAVHSGRKQHMTRLLPLAVLLAAACIDFNDDLNRCVDGGRCPTGDRKSVV